MSRVFILPHWRICTATSTRGLGQQLSTLKCWLSNTEIHSLFEQLLSLKVTAIYVIMTLVKVKH